MWKRIKRWFGRGESVPFDSVVDLQDAFVWECEICQHRNYADYVPMEPGGEEIATIKAHNESEEGQVIEVVPGDLARAPYIVQCGKCQHVFAVGNHFEDLA